jgi:superoxide dismutase
MDYGTKKPDYVAAIIASLNWETIGNRAKFSPLNPESKPPQ